MQGKRDWQNGFVAVDWGTTNRRAYHLDSEGGYRVLLEDGCGILSIPAGGFPDAVAQIRAAAPGLPLMLAGMIGSNRGWVEARYVPAPATLDAFAAGLTWADEDAAIVPGVSFRNGERADVMRGEEVQILGARAAGWIAADALVCHPGTHAKWIALQGDAIGPFRTAMTGELFSLLKSHSILAPLLAPEVADGPPFRAGVGHGLSRDDLTAELFSIRARHLLEGVGAEESASYASGLLIGTDIRAGLSLAPGWGGAIGLVGRPDLTALYAAALAVGGIASFQIDGEAAFLAGCRALAEVIA